MGGLFLHLFHLSISTGLAPTSHHRLHTTTRISNPPFSPKLSQASVQSLIHRCKFSNLRSKSRDPDEPVFRADEGGTVDDVDGYLNSLSLEYESVWDTKPSWCQPWTISLTGVLAVAFSWIIMHSVILTSFVLMFICAWWYIFLYSYPKAYSEMIAERRRKVTDGVEDTFGSRRS